ncbi:MAG: DUF1365 domain-containing protein [Methylococcaceae bacterium]|nr:DUF1365 domain-containing protein [Methylococcaceae bacterium]MDP2394559.1 DUF1365 domain-containing protein [Methylococcaceae bacterium]MDP3019956.1 DUF1365 domain-containing protein [Methylococcaceae bacterium]MDP3389261.1 DUF1365 domain-containing protein [Methylococcaceae bacterium]MDP3932271.1 DUF1365 domain-containing protein [Methylococcaceae bacterium]
MTELRSRLCEGWIRHRRYTPKHHEFRYPIFMTWLDLDELARVTAISSLWSLERFNLVSFFRKDYLGGSAEGDLTSEVKNRIKNQTGHSFDGRICLLTHCRFLGICFNPVSFYFCYPKGEDQPRYILAEVNNTPWHERFYYVLDTQTSPKHNGKWTFEFDKAFHVSPFMPMNLRYLWRFSLQDANVIIHMELHQQQQVCFDATLQLQSHAMTQQAMRNIPLHYPFMTCKVVVLIYWNALRLWLKGIPAYDHPGNKKSLNNGDLK